MPEEHRPRRPSSAEPPGDGRGRSRRAGAPGCLMVVAACVLFGLSGTASRVLIDHGTSALTVTQFRMSAGFLSLFLVLCLTRRDLLRLPWRRLPGVVLSGLALAAVIYCYSMAIARLPLAVALVLQYSAAAWLTGADAVRQRRRPAASVLVALSLTLGGVVLMVGIGGAQLSRLDPVGLLFGLATAGAYMLYLVCGRGIGDAVPAATSTLYGSLVAALVWCCVQPPGRIESGAWEPRTLVVLVLIGVLGMAAPFALVLSAVRSLGPARVSMLGTFEIVATGAIAYVWLGQALTLRQCFGGLLVVTGVAVCGRRSPDGEPGEDPRRPRPGAPSA
ncbi:DMT family transporter [Streptomyces sp. NPDC006743]|uniref:EamA family transporter n=1 Tax=Streptomyces sp. NPDC006743 TaxID=3154480 RepID=UPI00345639D8